MEVADDGATLPPPPPTPESAARGKSKKALTSKPESAAKGAGEKALKEMRQLPQQTTFSAWAQKTPPEFANRPFPVLATGASYR